MAEVNINFNESIFSLACSHIFPSLNTIGSWRNNRTASSAFWIDSSKALRKQSLPLWLARRPNSAKPAWSSKWIVPRHRDSAEMFDKTIWLSIQIRFRLNPFQFAYLPQLPRISRAISCTMWFSFGAFPRAILACFLGLRSQSIGPMRTPRRKWNSGSGATTWNNVERIWNGSSLSSRKRGNQIEKPSNTFGIEIRSPCPRYLDRDQLDPEYFSRTFPPPGTGKGCTWNKISSESIQTASLLKITHVQLEFHSANDPGNMSPVHSARVQRNAL